MLYSIYSKKINNITEPLEKEWLGIGSKVNLKFAMDILDQASELDNAGDYSIVILPDVYKGDKVLNKVTQEIAIVKSIIDYTSVIVKNIINRRESSIASDECKWLTKDLIVLGNEK